MKGIKDETLIELIEILIEYRRETKTDEMTLHLGVKTQAGIHIKYIDNEDDAQNTIKSLKKLLHVDINRNRSSSY